MKEGRVFTPSSHSAFSFKRWFLSSRFLLEFLRAFTSAQSPSISLLVCDSRFANSVLASSNLHVYSSVIALSPRISDWSSSVSPLFSSTYACLSTPRAQAVIVRSVIRSINASLSFNRVHTWSLKLSVSEDCSYNNSLIFQISCNVSSTVEQPNSAITLSKSGAWFLLDEFEFIKGIAFRAPLRSRSSLGTMFSFSWLSRRPGIVMWE